MDFEKESRVSVLEKVEEKTSTDFITENNEKKQEAKKTLFTVAPSTYMENLKKNFSKPEEKKDKQEKIKPKIEFKAAETFFSEKKKQKKTENEKQISFDSISSFANEKQLKNVVEGEVYLKDVQKAQIEPKIAEQQAQSEKTETIIEEIPKMIEEENTETIIEENTENIKKSKPKFKTRLKIICIGAVLVLACMIGWTIANAVEIKTLTAEMEQANKIYSVNIITHISNISKADDLTNPDSIFNLSSLSEAEVVPLQPQLQQPVEYSNRSNWFDRLCNWLSNLFK